MPVSRAAAYLENRLPDDFSEKPQLCALWSALSTVQTAALEGQEQVIAQAVTRLEHGRLQGNPWGGVATFCQSWEGLSALFEQVYQVTEQYFQPLATISPAETITNQQLITVAQALIDQDEKVLLDWIDRYCAADPTRLKFWFMSTFYPFMSAVSDHCSLTIVDQGSATCPLCGGAPFLATLAEEPDRGKVRRLCCGFCGTNWSFPRVHCPFCADHQPSKQGFFTLEGDEQARVDFCGKCSRYLKTLLQVPVDKQTLLWEDVSCFQLDLAAHQQGYW